MNSVLFELKPERGLLDSKFDGYKLSLEEIPTLRKKLERPVNVASLRNDEISYLHTKLFRLHNHLVGDKFDENVSVYYVDEDFNLCKMYHDPNLNEINSIKVFSIPKRSTVSSEIYNVTFRFVTENLAVLSDGSGMLYILNTGDRENDDIFTILYADLVIGENIGYVVRDAVYKHVENKDDELHVLLYTVQKNEAYEKVSNIVHWISISKKDNNWGQTALRQLTAKGDVQYVYLERNCEALYTISECDFKFTLNSEHPIVQNTPETNKKTHTWSQNLEELNIKIPLPENFEKNSVKITTNPTDIEVKYVDEILLSGPFYNRIDSELSNWQITNQCIEICLYKQESGLMWPELVIGNQSGEYILDSCIIQEVNERLQHLTSDTPSNPPTGTTFNSQQIEECDLAADAISLTFQRLCGRTNEITHKCYLGVHQVILTADLDTNLPPAIGLRHDVDVCLWQPRVDSDNFILKHEGTLLAFGYVQASKSNRKFCTCSSDLNYACISEFSRHLFIYRQNKPVVSTELRNRSTGRRVCSVAQQQVVTIPDEEVLGVYATNTFLFLLGKDYLLALKM